MKMTIHKRKENLFYLAMWILLFIAPVMTAYIRSINSIERGMRWAEVYEVWKVIVLFLVIFLVHNFIVAPLLIQKKKAAYFASVAAITLIFILLQCQRPGPARIPLHNPIPTEKLGPPPNGAAIPPPPPDFIGGKQPKIDGKQPKPHGFPPKPTGKHPIDIGLNDIIGVMLLLSLLGLNLGVKLYFKNEEDAKAMEVLQKQNLEQQLEYLKYQINPHFLMNTLNNIHALVDIDPERAKETIVIMSRIMRHMLYEGNKSKIPLQREVDFLKNYIELMRIRYTNQVDITLQMPQHIPDSEIPPLLFITFVENAFKHGVSYQQPSFIHISLTADEQCLRFVCSNSKRHDTGDHQAKELQGGVGLNNIKQRLSLLYGDNYHLEMTDGAEAYDVHLELELEQK